MYFFEDECSKSQLVLQVVLSGRQFCPEQRAPESLNKSMNSYVKKKSAYFNVFPLLILVFMLTLSAACEQKDQDAETVDYDLPEQPEIATGYTSNPGWKTSEFAVAAAHPLAADAGYQILKNGGSAVDAAIAIQLVLTLVEPQSSGIGGGAFLLHWDGLEVTAFNGRETAPDGANQEMFLDENGDPLPFTDAVHSGLSVGVPGTLAMLRDAHRRHGKLEWKDLFVPAITLAEEGFRITPRLYQQVSADERLADDEIARNYFFDEEGEPHPVGHTLKNPALARILNRISEEGISAFYQGAVADNLVERVRRHDRPGTIRIGDITRYPDRETETEPLCNPWREYRVCGFPPPSSGHLAVMQILGIMENLNPPPEPLRADTIPSAEWLHQFLEASKLAFADRGRYVGDPDFVHAPGDDWQSMLQPDYLSERASLIGSESMGQAEPGEPGELAEMFGEHPVQPDAGTSHISVIDPDGNAVSMTTTIEQAFGSRMMADGGTGLRGGYMLNNELTDFSFEPKDDEGRLIANRVQPGKQPRSSMSPTLVFDSGSGDLVATLGSPGGAAIIHYTAKTLAGMLGFGLDAQQAINMPNFANFNGPSVLEEGRFPEEVIRDLEDQGHEISERSLTSGIQAVQRIEQGWFGGADGRREGVVMGE